MTPSGRPVPPPDVDYVDAGDFLEIGDLFAGYCRDLAGLPPDGRVLDVGCGLGRLAGGRCLLTFFLLNPEPRRLLETLRLRELPYEHGIFRSTGADGRGSKAYDEAWVREVLSRRGLDLAVYYGSWCGRESPWRSSQDMVVGTKGPRPGALES